MKQMALYYYTAALLSYYRKLSSFLKYKIIMLEASFGAAGVSEGKI